MIGSSKFVYTETCIHLHGSAYKTSVSIPLETPFIFVRKSLCKQSCKPVAHYGEDIAKDLEEHRERKNQFEARADQERQE